MADCLKRCWRRKTPSSRDELNHASIIDGIRLCKAQRFRYRNGDMDDLESKLEGGGQLLATALIATDGVFSMDGYIAKLQRSAIWRRSTTRW